MYQSKKQSGLLAASRGRCGWSRRRGWCGSCVGWCVGMCVAAVRKQAQDLVGIVQYGRGIGKQDVPVQASDAVGQAANGIEVVLNPNDGAALGAPVLEQLFKNFYAFGIQRSHRLVEQQQVWRW